MKQTWVGLVHRLVVCMAILCNLPGCATHWTLEKLQALNPSVHVGQTCVHIPTSARGEAAFAYNSALQQHMSSRDEDEFEEFAARADYLYLYEPNIPESMSAPLPWPYHRMTCERYSSRDVPALPKGMRMLDISNATREALIASLSAPDNAEPVPNAPVGADKELVGQRVMTGHAYRRPKPSLLEETGQILRNAIREALPKVQRNNAVVPTDEQISIIDTKTSQVIGGMGAGGVISVVPGGVVIADAMERSGLLPTPTREFALGQGVAEMGVGVGQMIVGGTGAVGGAGASVTGGGALVGVPVCVAGVALAVNGAITFYHGARTVIVAICHKDELPEAGPQWAPATAGPSSTPAPATNPAPAVNSTPAAKPSTTQAEPGKTPATKNPSTGQPQAIKKACRYNPTQSSPNTITWTKCTGQMHHGITKLIHRELQTHRTLKNVYKYRDNRFVSQAINKDAHKGYQTWHRDQVIRASVK